MKGLLMKDIYNLSGQLKVYALFPILAFLLSYMQHNYVMFIFMMAMLVISIPMSAFAYDDMADFSSYALTLPISRKDIVLSKFILSLMIALLAVVASILGMYVMVQIFGSEHFGGFDVFEQSKAAIMVIFAMNAMNAFTFPIFFKYGSEKARLMLFVVMASVGAITFLINSFANSLPSLLSIVASYGLILGVLGLIIIEAGSIVLSNRIMDKKEF